MIRIQAKESDDQKALAELLDSIRPSLLWCHNPGEGKRPTTKIGGKDIPLYAIELKRRGVKPGVPDVLIFDSPPAYPEAKGLAIELKRKKGHPPLTKDQLQWLEDLWDRGWCSKICYGIDEAIEAVRDMGYLKEAN